MRKRYRTLVYTLALSITTVAFVAATTGVLAVNTSSVVNTGDDADVRTRTTERDRTVVVNQNTATVVQQAEVDADSGNNNASGNIGGSSVVTGDAAANAVMNARANENMTVVGGSGAHGDNFTDVVNSGDDATVNTRTTVEKMVRVVNRNNAAVSQSCADCSADTGRNNANGNVGGAAVVTGQAMGDVQFGTNVNSNTTAVADDGGMMGALNGYGYMNDTVVTNTGDDSTVRTTARHTRRVNVRNVNQAEVMQQAELNSRTGQNNANGNVGGALVDTGNAMSGLLFSAMANQNETGIATGQDGAASDMSDVINTGDDLTTVTNAQSTTTTRVRSLSTHSSMQMHNLASQTGNSSANGNVGETMVVAGTTMSNAAAGSSSNMNSTVVGAYSLLNMLFGI